MNFSPGDLVHLAGLGTGSVIEARGRDRYAIDIKGRIVVAAARDLEPADGARRARAKHDVTAPASTRTSARAMAAPSIDLHGKTTAEALELVEAFINEALLAGHAEALIVHGRGGGKVKVAVHQYLRQLAPTASFRLDPRNVGVTIVKFA